MEFTCSILSGPQYPTSEFIQFYFGLLLIFTPFCLSVDLSKIFIEQLREIGMYECVQYILQIRLASILSFRQEFVISPDLSRNPKGCRFYFPQQVFESL